jgi:epoxyqueuosine reductase QueG
MDDPKTAAQAAVSIIGEELPASFSAWAWLGRAGIDAAASCKAGPSAALPAALPSKYGLDRAGSLVVVALNYGEGPAEAPPWAAAHPGPLLGLARFARADWYAELTARLKALAGRTRSRLAAAGLDVGLAGPPDAADAAAPTRGWRFLANSGLPEKAFALAAGLGSRGRNDLVIVGARHGDLGAAGGRGIVGPACVLALLLLPFDIDALGSASPCARSVADVEAALSPASRGSACGSCRACIEACPTRALSEGGFARELCRQHWSARGGELPPAVEAAWGDMLYGCDLCLEACPHFRLDPEASCGRGLLGPGLPASWILESGEEEMRSRLRGSVLGMGWMDYSAFKRSARLALGHRP